MCGDADHHQIAILGVCVVANCQGPIMQLDVAKRDILKHAFAI